MLKTIKHKLRVISLFTALVLLIIALPIHSSAYNIPSGPTSGITEGRSAIISGSNKFLEYSALMAFCSETPRDTLHMWTIEYVSNGRYSIYFSGGNVSGYLGITGTRVSVMSDIQYWYFINNSDGTYTIVPANDTSKALTYPSSSGAVTVASSGNQKWRINPFVCIVNVEAYYDGGFKAKYGSNSNATSNNRILSIVDESQDLFFEKFGIYLSNTANGYKESLCDVCKGVYENDGDFESKCGHTDNHTYWINVAENFARNNHITSFFKKQVLFIGSRTFKDDGTVNGVSCSYLPTDDILGGHICIMKIYPDSMYDSRQGMVYAHEMGHQLGAPDHYCSYIIKDGERCCLNGNICSKPSHGPAGKVARSEDCIMDNMYNEGTSGQAYHRYELSAWDDDPKMEVFCEWCRRDMLDYISRYYNN